MARARQPLDDLAEISPAWQPAPRCWARPRHCCGEAAESLRQQLDSLEHDPAREDQIGDRLAEARSLARKHRCKPDELPELGARLARGAGRSREQRRTAGRAGPGSEDLEVAARACAAA